MTSFACFVLQHANAGNEWVGIDGNTGDIVDMKERKVWVGCQPPSIPVLIFLLLIGVSFQIWDSYNVKAQTFKTAIEAACMLLRIDDIVSGIKKKQAPGAGPTPSKPKIDEEGDADNEQILPE